MAFDGIITKAITQELKDTINLGKIEKVYHPEKEDMVLQIHTKKGKYKLLLSANTLGPRIHLTSNTFVNPETPSAFCMFMRKHIQGSRIVDIRQVECERVIEIYLESLNELGFAVEQKLVIEIMGKHSNIILVDIETNKILESIKRISIDTSRVRPVFPGLEYSYPPSQNKIPFTEIKEDDFKGLENDQKKILNLIGGISPNIALNLSMSTNPFLSLKEIINSIDNDTYTSRCYIGDGAYQDFHLTKLVQFDDVSVEKVYPSLSSCLDDYFNNKVSTNQNRQRSHQLSKNVQNLLNKYKLKLQRLLEDEEKARNSENLRVYGELLTANLHKVKNGDAFVILNNYYTGENVKIPLDPRYSPSKNAQNYYKKYGKAKNALKELSFYIEETEKDINYLESVLTFLENSEKIQETIDIRDELIENGYLRKSKTFEKKKKKKLTPLKYTSLGGNNILVGKNNLENDYLTCKVAEKSDYWFHTKDIPGSHIILQLNGKTPLDEEIIQCCQIAAYYSKGRNSQNIPVDYVVVKNVKKPSGAKPGMVIFTNNRTVWVNPIIPEEKE